MVNQRPRSVTNNVNEELDRFRKRTRTSRGREIA